jgi:putative peptidoglycan lipid II flippase
MRIALSGYYGFDNAGDEALLSAITMSLKRLRPDLEFLVFSGNPQKTQRLHGVEAVYYMHPLQVLRGLLRSDLLISGGGSIFQDVTSGRSLAYYISVVALAKLLGKPVIFYAQGVGPINRPLSRLLMRLVANRVDLITLRDEDSWQLLREIGVIRPEIRVTSDPVFALRPLPQDYESVDTKLAEIINPDKPVLGVSVRQWPALEGYQPELARCLDELALQGYQILFIPMAYPDDLAASQRVASFMERPAVLLDEDLSSREHLALISRMNFIIGMRLHALVFAASMGVPFAGISYDPKVDAFLKQFRLSPLPLQHEEMKKQTEQLINDDQLRHRIAEASSGLRHQAEENARLALGLLEEEATTPQPEQPVEVIEPPAPDPQPEVNRTGRTFIGVSAVIFLAKLLGFARDIFFASVFGTTIFADLFQVIFSFPSLLFSSIGTALSSVNIPTLTGFLKNRTQEERNQYFSRLMAQLTLWSTIIAIVGIIFAPAIARIIAPGISASAQSIAVVLTRIMMPTLLFVNLTYVTAGILQVHGHFMRSAAISIPFNILIILALLLRGDDIILFSYVTTIGWLLQFLIQLPVLRQEKYPFPRILGKTQEVVATLQKLVPVLLGNSLLQLCLIMDRSFFGTQLGEGSAAALSFGGNLFVTITSVFIVAMTTVVFPRLSRYALERDFAGVRELLAIVFKILLLILVPYLVLVVTYNKEIIALVYERGAFTSQSTQMTAQAFLFYSFAVVGYVGQEIFNRVFYALKKFKVPMQVSLVCLTINVLGNILMVASWGLIGLSAATALAMLVYAIIMAVLAHRELGGLSLGQVLPYAARLLIPVLGMVAVIRGFAYLLPGEGWLMGFLVPAALSGIIYLGLAYPLKLLEVFRLREAS